MLYLALRTYFPSAVEGTAISTVNQALLDLLSLTTILLYLERLGDGFSSSFDYYLRLLQSSMLFWAFAYLATIFGTYVKVDDSNSSGIASITGGTFNSDMADSLNLPPTTSNSSSATTRPSQGKTILSISGCIYILPGTVGPLAPTPPTSPTTPLAKGYDAFAPTGIWSGLSLLSQPHFCYPRTPDGKPKFTTIADILPRGSTLRPRGAEELIQIRIEQEAAAVAALPDYEDDEPDTTTSNPHAVRRRMEQEQERKAAKTMAEFEKNAAVEREKDLALQREIARLHRKHQLWMATWGSPGWRMPDKFVRARTSRRRW